MINNKTIKIMALALVTFFSASQASHALTVYADFDGDMLHDANYVVDVNTTSSLTVGVYASQSAKDVAAFGGLNGWGVDLSTGGLAVTGNSIANIALDPQWNFATIKNISDPAAATVRAVGNTLNAGGVSDLIVHLFDVELDIPAIIGNSYTLGFADISGDTFVSNNAFVYDDNVVFSQSTVSAVPVPAAVWFMVTGLTALVGIGRNRHSKV